MIEVKAIFVGAIAKLQMMPGQNSTEQHLPLVIGKEKIREV